MAERSEQQSEPRPGEPTELQSTTTAIVNYGQALDTEHSRAR